MIRAVSLEDSKQITEIYNYYVLNSAATFEVEPIQPEVMSQRISSVIETLPWLVYQEEKEILGYAYATKWKAREAYKNSVEITVYIKQGLGRKGIGSHLYEALLLELQEKKIHAVLGGITLPNESSIALHEKFGFQKVAHLKEIGHKFGRWLDVGYWQLIMNI